MAWRILIAVCVLSALAGRLTYLLKPFDNDAQCFIYFGKIVCDGGRLGHDLFDIKFPTVGLMTSPLWRLFGPGWAGYVLVQTAMGVGGALLLARAAARAVGEQARRPVLLAALVYFNLSIIVYGGFQLETMQCFFAILAAGAALEALRARRAVDAFVAGLAAGCAAMLKPTGGAVLAAFAVASVLTFYRRPRTLIAHGLAAAAGLALPLAVTLVYLVRTDTLRDMPDLYREIAAYAKQTPLAWSDLLRPLIVMAVVLFPSFVRGWLCRRERCDDEAIPSRAVFVVFTVAWLALELAGVVGQRRMYAYHFLPVVPPAALLVAAFPRRDRASALALALAPAMLLSAIGVRTVWEHRDLYPARLAVSDYIVAHTAPGDRVWKDYSPRLLIETGRLPGSRIPLTFLFFNYDTAPLEFSATMLRDFEVRRPKYIVLPSDVEAKIRHDQSLSPEMTRLTVRSGNNRRAWANIVTYVGEHYREETRIGAETLWRRRAD